VGNTEKFTAVKNEEKRCHIHVFVVNAGTIMMMIMMNRIRTSH